MSPTFLSGTAQDSDATEHRVPPVLPKLFFFSGCHLLPSLASLPSLIPSRPSTLPRINPLTGLELAGSGGRNSPLIKSTGRLLFLIEIPRGKQEKQEAEWKKKHSSEITEDFFLKLYLSYALLGVVMVSYNC